MEPAFTNIQKSINHLNTQHSIFARAVTYNLSLEQIEFDSYNENLEKMLNSFSELSLFDQLYN